MASFIEADFYEVEDFMKVNDLIDAFHKKVKITELEDLFILGLPSIHPFSDEGIAIKFVTLDDERVMLTDCGTTIDYLEEQELLLNQYQEKMQRILNRFDVEL